ncbi:MAG: hypothetical protein Q9220_000669 [cf. Caloplaca sp. 1 TL-2023]
MQSRNSILHMLTQLRPSHTIKRCPRSQTVRLLSHHTAFPRINTPFSTTPLLRRQNLLNTPSPSHAFHSHPSLSASPALSSPSLSSLSQQEELSIPPDVPKYQLTFTCKPCSHRSTHTVSKLGYEKGTVLITCPDCKNRHVMSDHLKIFSDKSITIEDIMREKGELVRRGRVGADGGDVEFWDEKDGGK